MPTIYNFDSSNLDSGSYDEDSQVLTVMFKSGRSYEYEAVPPSIAQGLFDAPSAGRYFSAMIRGVYPATEV